MSEMRVGRGWTEDELRARLGRLAGLGRSAPAAPLDAMRVRDGWRAEYSEAQVAQEPPGTPLADGPYERACAAVAAFAFSDPSIVAGHFDPRQPLDGRRMLLEIKVLGLRFLCGVEVVEVRAERAGALSAFGFRYDTLAGHLERGGEWFVVTKDHATGEVRMCIRSRWRVGDMPNRGIHVGFAALAPYYRKLWLHRAHERLRALIVEPGALREPVSAALDEEGPPTGELPPLTERARASRGSAIGAAAALGALTGVRSLSGATLLAARSVVAGAQPGAGRLERVLARPGALATLSALALGELIADKMPGVGDRTAAPALAGRIVFGALCGAVQALRWRRRPLAYGALGAASAFAAAVASHGVRVQTSERLGLPSALVGLFEDAALLGAAVALFAMLRRKEPPAYVIDHSEERRPRRTRLLTD